MEAAVTGAVISNLNTSRTRRCCLGLFVKLVCCFRCCKKDLGRDEHDGSYNYETSANMVNLVCCSGAVEEKNSSGVELNRSAQLRRSRERNRFGTAV